MHRHARRSIFVLAALGCVAVMMICSPMAQAETWDFGVTLDDTTVTDADVWAFAPAEDALIEFSLPKVATGEPQYEWSWEVTKVHLRATLLPNVYLWQGVDADYGDAGTHVGSLPFNLANEAVDDGSSGAIIKANLHLHVTADGKGNFDLTNIEWGTYSGYDVTGIAVEGQMTVNAVPEPTGLALLLSGALPLGLVALRRRRRR